MAVKQFSKEEAIKYRNKGMSHQEIADIMNCSKVWVSKAVKGIPRGQERVAVDETRVQAILMVRELLRKLEAL